jgi:hypothetical protein
MSLARVSASPGDMRGQYSSGEECQAGVGRPSLPGHRHSTRTGVSGGPATSRDDGAVTACPDPKFEVSSRNGTPRPPLANVRSDVEPPTTAPDDVSIGGTPRPPATRRVVDSFDATDAGGTQSSAACPPTAAEQPRTSKPRTATWKRGIVPPSHSVRPAVRPGRRTRLSSRFARGESYHHRYAFPEHAAARRSGRGASRRPRRRGGRVRRPGPRTCGRPRAARRRGNPVPARSLTP